MKKHILSKFKCKSILSYITLHFRLTRNVNENILQGAYNPKTLLKAIDFSHFTFVENLPNVIQSFILDVFLFNQAEGKCE